MRQQTHTHTHIVAHGKQQDFDSDKRSTWSTGKKEAKFRVPHSEIRRILFRSEHVMRDS